MDRRFLGQSKLPKDFDLNKRIEGSDKLPSPNLGTERITRTGSEFSGYPPAMQAVSELSERVLSSDRGITRADLQEIVESVQEKTEQSNTGRKIKALFEKESSSKKTKTKKEQMKKQWEKPDYRRNISEKVKKQWEDPASRSAASERMKKQWENSEFRQKMSEASKK
jgi:hypothetical protein